jgi:hypothetical protein
MTREEWDRLSRNQKEFVRQMNKMWSTDITDAEAETETETIVAIVQAARNRKCANVVELKLVCR